MADNASELKVAITTTADTSGVVAQTQAFKALEVGASKTYDAINVAQAKQELAEKSATTESRSAMQQEAQAALRQIEAKEKAAKAAKGAADASKALSGELRGLQQAGQGANQVMQGLSQGGIGGLIQSGRGAISMLRSLTTSALGAPLIGALATAGAGLYALKVIADDATKEIQRGYDRAAAAAKRQADAVEANKASAEKALKAQLADVEKLGTAWNELGNAVDSAQAREGKLTASRAQTADAKINLQEQQALATAKTPEERDAISRRFAGVRTDEKNKRASTALDAEELQSKVTENAARQTITDSDAAIRDAESRVSDKQRAFDRSQGSLKDFTPGTDAHEAAVAQAKTDKDALEREKNNLAAVIKEMTAAIEAANAKIDAAKVTREDVTERRKGLALQTGAEATQRANDTRQRAEEAGKPLVDLAQQRAGVTDKLKGLEDDKSRSLELGGNKETIAAIEAAKAELAKIDAETAKAQEAYAAAQKEASAAQLKQTEAQRADAAKAAQRQLSAQEGYHGVVVENFRGLQEQLDRQAKQIAQLSRARKASADAAQ